MMNDEYKVADKTDAAALLSALLRYASELPK